MHERIFKSFKIFEFHGLFDFQCPGWVRVRVRFWLSVSEASPSLVIMIDANNIEKSKEEDLKIIGYSHLLIPLFILQQIFVKYESVCVRCKSGDLEWGPMPRSTTKKLKNNTSKTSARIKADLQESGYVTLNHMAEELCS